MAGHSKWANIKHKKAAQDAKRGKVFTKLIREITVAARAGGEVVDDNPRLRLVVDKALGANMTRDTIDRAIKRGAGTGEDGAMDEVTYEGYGIAGVAVLVETLTDNVNRTVSDVRHAFTKHGGNLGTAGSVAYLFSKRGEIYFAPGTDEDALMEAALESGADDVESIGDGAQLVITEPGNYTAVIDALKAADLTFDDAEITMHPSVEVELDAETAEKVQRMIDRLEDLDDVQEVYTNAVFPDVDD